MSNLTFTQIIRNRQLHAEAVKAAAARAASAKRPKWAFNVLAYAAGRVEVFDDYTFARNWTKALGGGVVYPRDLVADYTAHGVALKEGLALHQTQPEEEEHDGYYGA